MNGVHATPEARADDRRAAGDAGYLGRLTALLGAVSQYTGARLQLAGLETKEAMVHYAIIAGLLAAGLIVVFFGYIFLCMAIIFAIAWLVGGPNTWIWLTFGMALLHFGVAVAAVFIAKSKFSKPMFTSTIDEFKKDQEWLSSNPARHS